MALIDEKLQIKLVRKPLTTNHLAFEQLSDQQKQIINHRASPLLVLGPAGSGKTTTLVMAIANRIANGEDPNQILAITYGRQSANRLRDQIATANPNLHTVNEPIARTFHSIAFLILNDPIINNRNKKYVLLSGGEQDALITELLAIDLENIKKDPNANLWPTELIPALSTRGFARELRDFIGRATERGSSPRELTKYASKYGQRYWPAICGFWNRYQTTLALRDGTTSNSITRIDPSEIIIAAIEKLESEPKLIEKYQNLFKVIYVDEFEESDRAQRKLLKLLSGNELVIFADPNSAVGRFRGADPDNLLADLKQFGMPKIVDLANRFRSEIAPVTSAFGSAADEANYIAHQIKSAHLRAGVAWSEMAVIIRSPGAQVTAITRAFAQNQIPISVDATALALAENPAIKPILTIAQIALGQLKLIPENWQQIEQLLYSEFAGADAILIRQMRVLLSKTQIGEERRNSTELILESLTAKSMDVSWEQLIPLKRLNDLIGEARKTLAKSKDISDLLWSIWSNARNYDGELISNHWQSQALSANSKSGIYDQNLDAVITLFELARRFSERLPGAKPRLFIDQLLGETILSDTITASAQRDDVVKVMTVHAAKGLQWRYVFLAGMQEGSWPNLKQRGSLLGTERLVEIFRHGISNPQQLDAISASGLVEDELRLLNVAISRASEKLFITAVKHEDNQPSRYFEKYAPENYSLSENERSLTQESLVATLRTLAVNSTDPQEIGFATSALKTLASNGVKSADPKNWIGIRQLSTTESVINNDEELRISPSSLESFTECALKWLLEQSGGKDADSTAQVLGTAIHVIAAQLKENPELSLDQLEAKLKGAWSLIDMHQGWIKDYEYRRAAQMLQKFYGWNAKNSNKLISVEEKFEFKLGKAVVSGSIDRIELTSENKYFIVDLKTGSTPISYQDAQTNKQLQSYQLAVVNNAFKNKLDHQDVAGAQLIYIGDADAKEAKSRPQDKVDSGLVTQELLEIASGMSNNTFAAKINDRCRNCGVKSSCPIQPQGRGVVD